MRTGTRCGLVENIPSCVSYDLAFLAALRAGTRRRHRPKPHASILGGSHTKIRTPEGFWQYSAIDVIKKSIYKEVRIDDTITIGRGAFKLRRWRALTCNKRPHIGYPINWWAVYILRRLEGLHKSRPGGRWRGRAWKIHWKVGKSLLQWDSIDTHQKSTSTASAPKSLRPIVKVLFHFTS